jgi:voltage-gated potassium channel
LETKDSTNEKMGIFNILIIILSIYLLFAVCFETFVKLPPEIVKVLRDIEDAICIIFLLDFFVGFFRADNKLQYMKWGWIDLISSIPNFEILRAGRILRLIRLLRILRAFRSARILIHHIFHNKFKSALAAALMIVVLLVIFSSIAILIVEDSPDSNIKTAEDAIWWTLVTVITAGSVDKYPVTTEGRMIALVLMTAGIGMFGTYTGYIASWFMGDKKKEPHQEQKI